MSRGILLCAPMMMHPELSALLAAHSLNHEVLLVDDTIERPLRNPVDLIEAALCDFREHDRGTYAISASLCPKVPFYEKETNNKPFYLGVPKRARNKRR